jgi:hypothetical protein
MGSRLFAGANSVKGNILTSGRYVPENVKTCNWAVILNGDDRSGVIAGTKVEDGKRSL